MSAILTVTEITSGIKNLLEESYPAVSIIGEISNFKPHVSGHWYFTLKDAGAQISCTMWKSRNMSVSFKLKDGDKIVVTGGLSVYPPRGSYQLDVFSMQKAGIGELQAAFENMKNRLNAEGLFDISKKKNIKKMPLKIGVVTAADGAAFRDMISVAERRYPLVEIILAPCRVQGEGAASQIASAIKYLDRQKEVDTIIVGRGGGSLEDLWAFNEEIVARAIYQCEIPVISAVGHEVDFTIADFVADVRAATPTAAMELATPNQAEILGFIDDFSYNSTLKIKSILNFHKDVIARLSGSYGIRSVQGIIRNNSQLLDGLFTKLQNVSEKYITGIQNRLTLMTKSLEQADVDKILKKGFAVISQEGTIKTRAASIKEDIPIEIRFFDDKIKIENGKRK